MISEASLPRQAFAVGALPEQLKHLGDRRRIRKVLRLAGFLGDVLAIVLAFMIGGVLRFGNPAHEQVLNVIIVVLPIYLAVAANNHSLDLGALMRARLGAAAAILAFLISLSAVGLVVFFLKVGTDFSRAVFGAGALWALGLIPLSRVLVAKVGARLLGETALNVVVIDEGGMVAERRGAIVLNAARCGLAPQLDDPAMMDRLGRCLESADRVIVACRSEHRLLWAKVLKGADVHGEVFAAELDELGTIGLADFHGRRTMVVAAGPLGLIDRSLKRALDLALVICTLPITLPLMAAAAIAIRIDSPGAVFFSQPRVGLGNRIFKLYKFRSMYSDRSDRAGERSTGRDDDRITRVGRFIRRTSIDELPQLFNVLGGSMSVVGPRPHALGSRAEDKLFWDIDDAYWHRHAIKPGMTGLAQVRGFRGPTETESDLNNRLQSDLEYLAGWSIWRDLSIIFATMRVMTHRNAF